MKYLVRTIAVILLLSLASCATPYAARGLTGGYKDEQVNGNTWRVSFNGNGYTSGDMVWYYWIYRCAELTRQHGFDVMVTVPEPKKTSELDAAPRFIPTVLEGGDEAHLVKTHGGGGGGHYVYVPGGTYSVTTFHSSSLIQMFHEGDIYDPRMALRAQVILDALKPYVDSSGKTPAPGRNALVLNALVMKPPIFSVPPPPPMPPKVLPPAPMPPSSHSL